jgi:excisionase family DNA binding protein
MAGMTEQLSNRSLQVERRSTKWLNIKEAAQHIAMSVAFLRKSVRNKTIPYSRVGTKALRFDRDTLDEWVSVNSCGGNDSDSKK